jgi:hypothetical protein
MNQMGMGAGNRGHNMRQHERFYQMMDDDDMEDDFNNY